MNRRMRHSWLHCKVTVVCGKELLLVLWTIVSPCFLVSLIRRRAMQSFLVLFLAFHIDYISHTCFLHAGLSAVRHDEVTTSSISIV
jgi:hypothetical protein